MTKPHSAHTTCPRLVIRTPSQSGQDREGIERDSHTSSVKDHTQEEWEHSILTAFQALFIHLHRLEVLQNEQCHTLLELNKPSQKEITESILPIDEEMCYFI